jgi:hypothetical protein
MAASAAMLWPAPRVQADWAALSADLAAQFVCGGDERGDLEQKVETFLRGQSFKVLNRAALQRERGMAIFELDIVALDSDHRIIELASLPTTRGRYAVALTSPPPTRHSTDLEDGLQKWIVEQLGCEIRQVERSENGSDARSFFESEIRRVENLFLEAERARGQRRL